MHECRAAPDADVVPSQPLETANRIRLKAAKRRHLAEKASFRRSKSPLLPVRLARSAFHGRAGAVTPWQGHGGDVDGSGCRRHRVEVGPPGATAAVGRNGDPDPISAGTAGDAARRGGSSAAVGMAANPFGAHQVGHHRVDRERGLWVAVLVEAGACGVAADRPSIWRRGALPVLPGIEHGLRLSPSDQPLELTPTGPHPTPELGQHRVVLLAVDLAPERRALQRAGAEVEGE